MKMPYWFVQIATYIIANLLFRIKISGLENLPRQGAFILASNHKSHLDPIIIAGASTRKLHFIAKKELVKAKFVGSIMNWLSMVLINREGVDRTALKHGLRLLHSGRVLALFPEGTRSKDGRLGRAHAGVALFALTARVPVIPAFVSGTERALPAGSHRIRIGSRIGVVFGKPIAPYDIADRSNKKAAYQELTNRVMQEIANLGKKAA